MNRENIYKALFDLLKANATLSDPATGCKTFGRLLKHWDDVGAAQQPALFLMQGAEDPVYVSGNMPAKWQLHPHLYLYVNTSGDSARVPASVMNPLLDAIVSALTPNPVSNTVSLGGQVEHCRIGRIETDEGVLGVQGVAIIPIDIVST